MDFLRNIIEGYLKCSSNSGLVLKLKSNREVNIPLNIILLWLHDYLLQIVIATVTDEESSENYGVALTSCQPDTFNGCLYLI